MGEKRVRTRIECSGHTFDLDCRRMSVVTEDDGYMLGVASPEDLVEAGLMGVVNSLRSLEDAGIDRRLAALEMTLEFTALIEAYLDDEDFCTTRNLRDLDCIRSMADSLGVEVPDE